MKILFVTIDYPPQIGGIAEYLSQLVAHIPASEDVVVLSPSVRRLLWSWIRPRWIPALVWTCWYVWRRRPDLIVVSHVVPIGMIARWCDRLFRIPYVVIAHGMDVALARDNRSALHRRAQKVLRDAFCVVVNSQYTGEIVKTFGVRDRNIFFLPPSPTITDEESARAHAMRAETRQKYGAGDGPIVLSVCRLVERKNVMMMLEAFRELARESGDSFRAKCIIVGDGPEKSRLENFVREHDLGKNVFFAGAVPRDELHALYAACDLFVLTPQQIGGDIEGFGTVYLEANTFAKPVIGSRTGGVSEAVVDGVTGVLVDENDVTGLKDALQRLITDTTYARLLGTQGQARVQRDFGWSIFSRNLVVRMQKREPSPLVSIIIPTYQHAKEIPLCLESIFLQTYTNYEIIVVNDGSTDATQRALEKYRDRITLITQENRGGNAARNRGFVVSKGEYVLFCDADVIMRKDFLQKSVETLLSNPQASYAYCSYRFGWKKFHAWPFDSQLLQRMNYIHTTSLMRRSDFPRFDESIKKLQDWDLWLTMLAEGKTGVCIPHVLFRAIPHHHGISVWVPGFLYRIPWQTLGLKFGSIDRYNAATKIIRAKHHLDDRAPVHTVVAKDAGPSPFVSVHPKTFFQIFVVAIIAYFGFEIVSFLGYVYPWIANVVFFILCGVAAALALFRVELAVLLLVAELSIGSQGGAMISFGAEQGQGGISLRLGLFLAVMGVWLATRLTLFLSRNTPQREKGWLWLRAMQQHRMFVLYCFLLLLFVFAMILGVVRKYSFSTIFFDANGYAYFALFPIFIHGLTILDTYKKLFAIVAAAVTVSVLKALFVLYIFSHRLFGVAKVLYAWVRDTRVGEITRVAGDFYRVFFQSHLFAVMMFFFMLTFLLFRKRREQSWIIWALFVWSMTGILMGFSRSFWFGIIVTLLFLFCFLLSLFEWRRTLKKLFVIGCIGLFASMTILFTFYTFPVPQKDGSISLASLLSDRLFSSDDAATKSRWALLPKLFSAGREYPLFGSGLGRTVTYETSDPRLLSTLQKSEYTTYAFEWGYLDLWVKFGFIGLIIYGWFLFRLIAPLWRGTFESFDDGADMSLLLQARMALLLSLVALLVTHMFSPYLNHPLGIGIVMIAGALVCNDIFAVEKS